MNKIVSVGIIGDFSPDKLTHQKLNQALDHAATALGCTVEITWIPTLSLKIARECKKMRQYDALVIAPGGAYYSEQGVINGIQYAREQAITFLGICGGFQYTLLEYARNVAGLEHAAHLETESDAEEPLITPIACDVDDRTEDTAALCGRLTIEIVPDTLAFKIYGLTAVEEFFNCDYELNPDYQDKLVRAGLIVSGSGDNHEARIIELNDDKFFMGTAFQPHMLSEAGHPHPILVAFIRSALGQAQAKQ